MAISCFKAYDIRGKVPEQLSEALAFDIARAFAAEIQPSKVVVGYDIRLESPGIAEAIREGLLSSGVDVLDIGLCGTEEIYFSTFHHELDGGIMVTASHNPKGYNGLKLVREGSRPISGDTGLKSIERRVEDGDLGEPSVERGTYTRNEDKTAYVDHLLTYVDADAWAPLSIVMNSGNGSAGAVIEQLVERLPCAATYVHLEPDGNFPNGVPNPLLVENRSSTANTVREVGADFGIAWDGDYDRCFFFDHEGNFIEGYYVVGLLADMMLQKHPGASIIHDPRLVWNTVDIVNRAGGTAIMSKTGHAFIKERMRKDDAIYGGEMSAHHYFKDFAYCDSGMIPWLLVAELICRSGKRLSELVEARIEAFPCSGERNYRVGDIPATINRVLEHYESQKPVLDRTDGLSLEFDQWRMSIRASNTEPLLRVNIETKGSQSLVESELKEVEAIILADVLN